MSDCPPGCHVDFSNELIHLFFNFMLGRASLTLRIYSCWYVRESKCICGKSGNTTSSDLIDLDDTKKFPPCMTEGYESHIIEQTIYLLFQDFCKPTNWPPLSELRTLVGGEGESCIATCLRKQLICEPKFFVSLDVEEAFKRWDLIPHQEISCLAYFLRVFCVGNISLNLIYTSSLNEILW